MTKRKSARWRGAIHTANTLATKRRRLDRRACSVETVLSREGARLCLHYDHRRGPVWRLTVIGSEVPDGIARAVIQRPEVVGVGDALFQGVLNQTYRHRED
jgi:hypothetical protein